MLPGVDAEEAIKARKSAVRVIDVKIPGMLLDCYSTVNETKTLGSFGDAPFVALINNRCLKTASESIYIRDKEASAEKIPMPESTYNCDDKSNSGDQETVPSRILKDAFHIMQMVKISLNMVLYVQRFYAQF